MGAVFSVKPVNFAQVRQIPKANRAAIEEALDQGAAEAIVAFQRTTQTWDKKPKFYIRKTGSTRRIEVNSVVWFWIDLGTRAHGIVAKGGGTGKSAYLTFRTGYAPKTFPNIPDSFRGGTETGRMVRTLAVWHPGIQARNFTEKIRGSEEKRLSDRVAREIARAQNKIF